MAFNDKARELARRHPHAHHIIYDPSGDRAYYCSDSSYGDHDPNDPRICPYIGPDSTYPRYVGYQVATVAELTRPAPPTSHSTWEAHA